MDKDPSIADYLDDAIRATDPDSPPADVHELTVEEVRARGLMVAVRKVKQLEVSGFKPYFHVKVIQHADIAVTSFIHARFSSTKALMEYLIKTYTDENETVLDNCMGAGSTGIACARTDRQFIGIEKDKEYFDIAERRINEAYRIGRTKTQLTDFAEVIE